MPMNEWAVEYYVEDSGHCPVEAFVESLDHKTRSRLFWSFRQLELRNVQAREPLVRPLEGKIWELRERSRTNIYRVLYFFFRGRRIVLLHAFQKKTQRTPRREIEVAQRRLARFLAREGA